MNDPYKILGVSPDADDKEIKDAYKKLVRKYHPDKYQNSDLKDVANEKMTEINAAYDEIMSERRNGGYSSGYSYRSYGGTSSGYNGRGSVNYSEVRAYIHSGNIAAAERILNSAGDSERNAEWYFLMGTVYYQKGWTSEAYSYISRAARMDPSNREYAAAVSQLNGHRGGYMQGNAYNSGNGMDTLNCLSDLCIADCCCEMMGGDLIPCC